MILQSLSVGELETNCYLLARGRGCPALIVDPGADEDKIRKALARQALKPVAIINTHGHVDHITCDDKFGLPVYAHRKEIPLIKNSRLNLSEFMGAPFSVKAEIHPLEDKEIITLAQIEMEVIHLPGHTPGGIALLLKEPGEKILFSGDSLFYHSIGRTDFPGASTELLVKSIKEKLFILDDDTVVYPGHGPSTTIGEEKKRNQFLQ